MAKKVEKVETEKVIINVVFFDTTLGSNRAAMINPTFGLKGALHQMFAKETPADVEINLKSFGGYLCCLEKIDFLKAAEEADIIISHERNMDMGREESSQEMEQSLARILSEIKGKPEIIICSGPCLPAIDFPKHVVIVPEHSFYNHVTVAAIKQIAEKKRKNVLCLESEVL